MNRGRLRLIVLEILAESQTEGRTWREVADIMKSRYLIFTADHGSVSGALSNLNAGGRVERLTEKRNRCSVYVLPKFIEQRPIAAPRTSMGGWMAGYDAGFDAGQEQAKTTDPRLAEIHRQAREEGQTRGRNQARAEALVYVETLLLEASKNQPVQTHSATCWRWHPACALIAVKKNLTAD